MSKNLRVLVLYNDPEPEHDDRQTVVLPDGKMQSEFVSVQSEKVETKFVDTSNEGLKKEVAAIRESLAKVGFGASSLNLKNDLQLLLDTLERREMDVIFNLVESFNNESEPEMYVAGLYDLYKIPYTGAGPKALGNCLDKTLTKHLLKSYGIRVPRYKVVKQLPLTEPIGIPYPLIIKPIHEDASAGIENDSVVFNRKQLLNRIEYIHKYFKQAALVEQYVEGREFNVSVVGSKYPITFPVSEIDFSSMPDHLHNIVSYQAKWMPEHEAYKNTIPICPAKIPQQLSHKLSRIALLAHRIMGTRDYARVDMRVDKNGKVYVLEVNPNPDISRDAGFMRAARAYGWNHQQTLKHIIEYALERA